MKLENKYGAPVECAIPLEKLATPQRRRGGDDSGFTNCNPAPEASLTSLSSPMHSVRVIS